jgi:hypothetical protein
MKKPTLIFVVSRYVHIKKYSKPLAHEHLHQGEWGTGK